MFSFVENFDLYDENYKPYGVFIRSSSNYWHHHARCEGKGYVVSCTGNKYFLHTPKLSDFKSSLRFKFGALNKYAAISFFFGYDIELFCGYELRAEWKEPSRELSFRLFEIIDEREPREICQKTVNGVEFPHSDNEYTFSAVLEGERLCPLIYKQA